MTSEENSKIETLAARAATPKPLDTGGNLVLSLKLLFGATILGLLFWYLDSHVAK
jgi:hypothetical protein